MDENTTTAISYICFSLIVCVFFLSIAWVISPTNFKIKLETDDNTLKLLNETIGYQNSLRDNKEVSLCIFEYPTNTQKCYHYQKVPTQINLDKSTCEPRGFRY